MDQTKKKPRARNRKKNQLARSSLDGELDKLQLDDSLPFRVKKSDILGRYLVASKDLPAGELLIEEDPLVVGPSQQCGVVCLGCYISVELDSCARCLQCHWPLCSSGCRGLHTNTGHSTTECNLLSRVNTRNFEYEPITPLRCVLLKTVDPAKWTSLNRMEHHNALRKELKHLWDENQTNVVDVIRNKWNIRNYSEEELHTVCGILETNAFDASYNDSKVRALYPTSFLFSHDCISNTAHTNDASCRFKIRTSVPVLRDQPLTLTYTYVIEGTIGRRDHLRASKFFDCSCRRCGDPTELKTWASCLVCSQCGEASLIPVNPLSSDSLWRCRKPSCGREETGNSVRRLLDKLSSEVKALDPDDLSAHEAFLETYKNTLHRNHHFNLWVKHSLAQMYGKVPGYLMAEMTDDQLMRKIVLCEDLLSVINVLDPGLSRLRGVLLYELHAPLMVRITRQSVSKVALRLTLKKIITSLRESELALKFECQKTQEGQMAEAARQALQDVYQWEKIVGKLRD